MTREAQRIAIAEACGWESRKTVQEAHGLYYHPILHQAKIAQGSAVWKAREKMELPMDSCGLPDYLGDLNAVAEAEKTLDNLPFHQGWQSYEYNLLKIVGHESFSIWGVKALLCATAAQRGEAFLRTVGKWDDSK